MIILEMKTAKTNDHNPTAFLKAVIFWKLTKS